MSSASPHRASPETPAIDGVIGELESIVDKAIEHGERHGYFAALYLRVTRAVRARVLAGDFDDGPRMDRLDAAFAQRYLDAFRAYQDASPLTQSWRIAFDAGQRWRPLILQHLLLGMNAHINLDLGIAAAEVSEGTDPSNLEGDFMRINAILASLTDDVGKAVAQSAPLAGILDFMGGRTDEMLANFSLELARDGAWELAQQLAPLSPAARAEAIESRDVRVSVLAEGLARPGPLLSTLTLVPRLLERGTPGEITRALSG